MGPLLEVQDLGVSYRTRAADLPVLRRVSFTLERGEALGLVGESGCGKSTLALALLRHVGRGGRVAAGTVRFRGRDIAGFTRAELRAFRGGGIGMVYQDAMSALNPSLRVGTQLAEAGRYHRGSSWAAAAAAGLAMLRRVQLPDPERVMAAFPHQLSGGQQQRVVIAMALLAEPDVLVLDEPTTALDATVEAGIVALIAELRRQTGMALLFVSHSLGLVSQVCERVAVMYAGEVVESGPTHATFAAPAHPYTAGLLRCVPRLDQPVLAPIPGTVPALGDLPRGCSFGPRCPGFMSGRCGLGPIPLLAAGPSRTARCVRLGEVAAPAALAPPPREWLAHEVALAADAVEKTYAVDRRGLLGTLLRRPVEQVRANRGVTLSAGRGRTVAIVGESGCGKSTFARIVAGLESASGGTVVIGGAELGRTPLAARSAAQVRALQMVFQNPDETLNPSYRVGRQIARVVRKLGGLRGPAVRERAAALLAATRLSADIGQRWPHELSGGQKQRVAIARAFAGDPALLVADEPVSALDVSVRAAVTALLMELQARRGTTVLLISHDLALVRAMADEVVVMYAGQVMEAGPAAPLFARPRHPYTAALIAAMPRIGGDPAGGVLPGEVPSALAPPAGCPFHPRCARSVPGLCDGVVPVSQPGAHRFACHNPLPVTTPQRAAEEVS